MQMESCSHVGAVSNAGTGAFSIGNSDVASVSQTNAAGSITIYGGFVGYCLTSTGSVVWWINDDELKVLTTMKIAHALAVATSGDVITLDQAVFAESNLTAKNGVDIVGLGSDSSIIEAAGGANPIIAVGTGVACALRGIRVSNTNGVAVALTAGAEAATVAAQDCEFRASAGTNIVTLTTAGAGAPAFTASSCIFRTGAEGITVTGAVVANVIARNCTFASCTLVFSTTGANHTFGFDYCHFGSGGVTLSANAPVVTLTECEDIGTFTHSTASTVTLYHCRLSGAYTTGAVAAIVTAYATTLAAFTHNGTGAITLDNCALGAVANNSTATMTIRESHMGNLTQAAAAGTINVYNSSMADISTGAAGTIRLEGGCRFNDIAANAGVLTWKVDPNHIKVVAGTANMKIADALAAAAAGDIITIYPGTYAESNLTLKASVDLVGTDPEQCLIVADGGANPILNAGVTCAISNLTVGNTNLLGPAVRVTANTLTVRNCYLYGTGIGDAIAMTAGNLDIYDTTIGVGDIDLSTAACALSMYRCRITTDPVDTAGVGLGHTLTFVECEFSGQNIASAATGATTLETVGCSNIGQVSNAGTGTFNLRDTDVQDVVTTSTGGINIYTGHVRTCSAASAGGAIVWWQDNNLIYVIPNMLITHAVAVALTGDTIMLGQGIWADTNLSPATGVDIVGQGKEISVIDASSAVNPVFAIGNNISITIRGITIDNDAAGGAIRISPVANSSTLVIEDCDVINAGASDCVVVSIGGAGNGTLTARRCNFTSDAANSIVVLAGAGAGLLYFNSWDCNFDTSGGAGNAAIEASATVVADVNVYRAVFTNCTRALYCTGANHTVDIEDSEFSGCDVELAGNVPAVNLTKCNSVGAFAHSVACTVNLRDCYLSDTYTIGAVAGVVNAYHTQFSTFTNGGSGAIAFQECNGTDINNNSTSTMTVEGGHWDTVLQGAAAGTINIYEAVIATEFDCSAGGAINAYNCDVASIDSNGGTITLYEGELRAVSDATGVIVWWEAPHQLRVIASTANMKIQDAIDAADAGDTISIGPGTFSEALTCNAAADVVTLIGEGRDKTIITQAAGDVLTVTDCETVCVENLTIQVTAGAGHNGILVNAAAANAGVALRGVKIDVTGTLATTNNGISLVRTAATASLDAFDVEITTSNTEVGASTTVAANITGQGTVRLRECILDSTDTNGTAYSLYIDQTTVETWNCRFAAGIIYITNNATSIGVSHDDIYENGVAPVTFAGAAGEFADLSGAKLYTCAADLLIGEACYVSGANTVDEATNAAAAPIPAEGIVVYKPAGAAGTTCYVKNSGHLYMATPPVGWVAGTNVWLGAAGAQLVARPSNALKQVLGVGVDTKRMLINISNVEVVTKVATIPVWPAAGTAPTGTHVNVNSRKAVAVVGAAGQTVFSHAWEVPEDFLSLSALKVIVFPTGTGTFDWTAYSSACANGELENANSDTATADGQAVTDDTILDHDITGAADGYTLQEGDHFNCDLVVDVLTTITQLLVLGFRVEYSAQRGA
jgi:hypothetical protein